MTSSLPDGTYPFIDQEHPLKDMAMVEAPAELEAFLKQQASATGIEIVRDRPVELTCRSDAGDTTFLIWYPSGQDRLHILVPKEHVTGRV